MQRRPSVPTPTRPSCSVGHLPANTRSAADVAFLRFREFRAEGRLFQRTDTPMTEADTRAKLIDPLFRDVLGWNETEIRRERPVRKGYADYVLGSEFNYLLIEAKRAAPRFNLQAPTRPRRLALSGPHLLGHKKIAEHLEQAQAYASDTGVQFCLVTNGSQFIIFQPFVPGRGWREGTALVYHDLDDLEQHFAEFHSLLYRDGVIEGSLVEAFAHVERTTTTLFSALQFIADPDRELVRNRVWQQISRTIGPLLTDQSEDLRAQLDVIRNCYVTTPLADQTDQSLNALLRDAPSGPLLDAGVVDLRPGSQGRTAFSHRMSADFSAGRRGSYVLTGGVGSGKTTFLRRFAHVVETDLVRDRVVWLHVDFLPMGSVDRSELDVHLRSFVYRELRKQLDHTHALELCSDGARLRRLFSDEIEKTRLTLLYNVSDESDLWHSTVNQKVDQLFADDEVYVTAALRFLRRSGRRIAVALDNTDQLGEIFQEAVFLLSQRISAEHEALAVVTLREEKFFAAYRRGIFDAFGDRRFHIGSPDLRLVLRKRLEYGRQKFEELQKQKGVSELSSDDYCRIDGLLRTVINSTTERNANIVRMLASVSNGDMRHALDMFREFLSSGNTNIEKILEIVSREGGYTVPFHEFAKSAILGSRRHYRSSVSHVVNAFKQSDALEASHLTSCRILARLSAAEGVASSHGEGFVGVPSLLREYRGSFGLADDFTQWADELLRRSLIESEPPRVGDVRKADAVRITAAGAYYWRYLIRSFAYVDLVFVDTPIADKGLASRLATMAELTDLTTRFERVRAFLSYLLQREAAELSRVAARVGAFQEALIPGILRQIEEEIRVICGKTGIADRYGPE